MKKALIIGAGISGLSLAFYLQKKSPIEITFLEKRSRAGGWMHTDWIKNYRFESGPRFFKGASSSHLLDLIDEVGLSDQIVCASKKALRRYIYKDEKLHLLPSNLFSYFVSHLTRGTFTNLISEFFQKKSDVEDETIYEFIHRRFGSQKIDILFDALVQGIFAGDIRRMSMRSCFPKLFFYEKEKGSILRGMFSQKKELLPKIRGLFTLQGGMASLVERLKAKIDARWEFSSEVQAVESEKGRVITNEKDFVADQIYLAVPSYVAGKLLRIETLQKIRTPSLHVVNMGFDRKLINTAAFGYLIPASEKEKVIGCSWDSCIYPFSHPKGDVTRLAVMMGGAHNPEIDKYSDHECITLAREALSRHMGIDYDPEAISVTRAHRGVVEYGLGHQKMIASIEKALPKNVSLVGNYFEGLGVSQCIKKSKEVSML